jgi:ATP-dependent Lhr-like helicase
MFVLPDEVRLLDEVRGRDDKLRILSLYDSFLSDKWTEITSRFGEAWIYPLVRDGRIVGMIEKWLLAGSVEVRDIQLEEPDLLGQLVGSIDDMMPFYNSLGVEIVRITSVFGADVEHLHAGVKQEFLRRGYTESNGMLVKGNLVTPCFERNDILNVLFSLQNLGEGSQLLDMTDALVRYGGLRSNAEALLRVKKFESLQRLHKRGAVVRGHIVPDRVGYCRAEEAGLYMSARRSDLTADEKLVLRIVKDQQPVKRDRLLDLSPLGRVDTVEAMKALYTSSRTYLDSSLAFVSTKRQRTSRESAWTQIVKRLFDNYGIMTAESLGMLLGHEIPMREIRRVLRILEDEKLIVKGFLLRGSGALHWASIQAYSMLGNTAFSQHVVLSPEDNLTQFLRASYRDLLPETGRHTVFQGTRVIGSFEGKIKAGRFEVSDLQGDPTCPEIVGAYARSLGLAMRDRDEGRVSDWEIMDFYQRTHPGLGDE